MTLNKLNAKCVVASTWTFTNGIHQLRLSYDVQLITDDVIDDALLQAMPDAAYQAYADLVFWHCEILSSTRYHILIKYCGFLVWVQIRTVRAG